MAKGISYPLGPLGGIKRTKERKEGDIKIWPNIRRCHLREWNGYGNEKAPGDK